MAGWGATITGISAVESILDEIQVRWTGDVVYVVGTNVEYAVYQEFGTSKMPAQPYLGPAARDVERRLDRIAAQHGSLEAVVKAVALEVEAEAKRRVPVDTGRLRASLRAERIK